MHQLEGDAAVAQAQTDAERGAERGAESGGEQEAEAGGEGGDGFGDEGEEEEGARFGAEDVEEARKMIERLIVRTELALNKHHNAKKRLLAQQQDGQALADAIALNSSAVALTGTSAVQRHSGHCSVTAYTRILLSRRRAGQD